jgi:hypothetical protein
MSNLPIKSLVFTVPEKTILPLKSSIDNNRVSFSILLVKFNIVLAGFGNILSSQILLDISFFSFCELWMRIDGFK